MMGRLSNVEEFVEKAIKKWGRVFDYTKVVYVRSYLKVIIICPKHGEFRVTPGNHLSGRGKGCPTCSNEERNNRIAEIGRHPHRPKGKKLEDRKKTLKKNGYVAVSMSYDEQLLYKKRPSRSKSIEYHIVIMAKKLGRPIDTQNEDVHHKNGIKNDNRPSNLEIKIINHGRGHSVEDAVKHAVHILITYAPKKLSKEALAEELESLISNTEDWVYRK